MSISRRMSFAAVTLLVVGSRSTAFGASEFEPEEIDVKTVAAIIASRPTLLIDARAADEFAVSHLDHALRADPDATPEVVLALAAGRLQGAAVILYCTVGTRSMGLGINVQDHLLKAGAESVHVMKDGIVAWANASLPLVDHKGVTRFVHPSDQSTRDRLTDPSRGRFEPRP